MVMLFQAMLALLHDVASSILLYYSTTANLFFTMTIITMDVCAPFTMIILAFCTQLPIFSFSFFSCLVRF